MGINSKTGDVLNRRGLGLGLAITREAVVAHSGELSVRDLPGKGCVFTVKLFDEH